MIFERFCTALGHLAFLGAVGLVMTTMTFAALNAASYSAGPMCHSGGCITLASN